MIISVLNQKGGTGKTTIACNLAVAFKLKGNTVCIIDADKQGTTAQFRSFRKTMEIPQVPMYQILTDTIETDVPALNFEHAIIDVGGKDTMPFRGCMLISDIVIVPMQPSSPDIWSSEVTFKLLADARKFNKKLKIIGLFNMVDQRVSAASDIPDLVDSLGKEYQITFFKSQIGQRVQYKYTLGSGLSILEQTTDKRAIEEFSGLFGELQGVMDEKD